jgi:signal transduction histidine kinase
VGGYVLDYTEQGKITAEDALEILRGRSPSAIAIRFVPGAYMFDARQIHRWGMSERHLPAASNVLYEEYSEWQQIKWTVIISALIVLSLGALTIYLLHSRRQLTRARNEQLRLSGILINAHEEERKRLASELHDDFSQRLALLSIGMESAAELLQSSPKDAKEQLNELVNLACELSADIHSCSHSLHSSTLERLGLVAGVKAFCHETNAQGVHVEFSYVGKDQQVPPLVALCFYRVLQEALRNIRRHSGALTASVRLRLVDDELHLSISDQGSGFDIQDLRQKEGIGIFTMEERARYVGARFELHSEPGKGTRVDIWKQLDQKHPESMEIPESPEFANRLTA